MGKKLKVGIAGYGVVGIRRHEFLNKHPNCEVVSICDNKFKTNVERPQNVKVFANAQDMMARVSLDALYVCLPNELAPEITVEALNYDLHVFCEKPPGRSVQDIRNVIAVEKNKPHLKLKYGFNHRYHDSVIEALRIIKGGELGHIINMKGTYGKSAFIPWPRRSQEYLGYTGEKEWRTNRAVAGGGILLDQGIHMVDLMQAFGGEFKEVKSFVKNNYWNHDVEDNAYALMSTEEGVVGFLHSTSTQWRHTFCLDIHMTEGALLLKGILSGSRSYGQESLTIIYRRDEDNGNPQEQTTTYINDHSWWDEICEFTDCILNDKPVEIGTSEDALKTMETVFRIYRADKFWAEKYHIS